MANSLNLENIKQRRRHYETTFIVSPSLSDAQASEISDRIRKTVEQSNGVLLRLDNWGKKRMAYMIEKHAMGNFFYLRFIGSDACLKAAERSLKLDANVLRYLSISLSQPLSDVEVQELVERAPREASQAPSLRTDEEESLEVAYS